MVTESHNLPGQYDIVAQSQTVVATFSPPTSFHCATTRSCTYLTHFPSCDAIRAEVTKSLLPPGKRTPQWPPPIFARAREASSGERDLNRSLLTTVPLPPDRAHNASANGLHTTFQAKKVSVTHGLSDRYHFLQGGKRLSKKKSMQGNFTTNSLNSS